MYNKSWGIFLSGFSISTISSFKDIGDKHDLYKGKYYIRKFFESLKKHTVKVINNEKIKLLQKSSRNQMKVEKSVIFVKETLQINMLKIVKLEIIVIKMNIDVLYITYVNQK